MFYKPNNKIIIVDDKDEDLKTLSKEFHNLGIGCRTYKYDISYGIQLNDVRIAFFDININPFGYGSDDSQLFNNLAFALKQYISPSNGPYILIFWTDKVDKFNELKDYLSRVHPDIPKPFLIGCLGKPDFALDPVGKINSILDNKIVELLFDFEEVASKAAALTIKKIYDIIPKENDKWGSNDRFNQNFELIFSKIASSVLGISHAKENPDKAVYDALLPILNYHISENNDRLKWKSFLISLNKNNPLSFPSSFEVGKLNSIFHIESGTSIDTTVRGAVSEFLFPLSHLTTCNTYHRCLSDATNEILQQMVCLTTKFGISEIIEKSKFVLIETSSSCDFAQRKDRNFKFLLGLLMPENDKIDKSKISNSIFYKELPILNFENVNYFLFINLNRTFSGFEITDCVGNPLFILKKEIMDMIGNRYANHVSRIGITSF